MEDQSLLHLNAYSKCLDIDAFDWLDRFIILDLFYWSYCELPQYYWIPYNPILEQRIYFC